MPGGTQDLYVSGVFDVYGWHPIDGAATIPDGLDYRYDYGNVSVEGTGDMHLDMSNAGPPPGEGVDAVSFHGRGVEGNYQPTVYSITDSSNNTVLFGSNNNTNIDSAFYVFPNVVHPVTFNTYRLRMEDTYEVQGHVVYYTYVTVRFARLLPRVVFL